MSDWDLDSARSRANLNQILDEVRHSAELQEHWSVETARGWQRAIMQGLDVSDPRFVGAFRGEPGLQQVEVQVSSRPGVEAGKVAVELAHFEARLQAFLKEFDALLPAGRRPDEEQIVLVVDFCAWTHAEWVRIHPFANGNGRTARLWANAVATRYALPAFLRLRPRPGSGYAEACASAMLGDWRDTTVVFWRLLYNFLDKEYPGM